MERAADGRAHRNLELKARCPDLAAAHRAARRLGAADGGVLQQRDTYFRVPVGPSLAGSAGLSLAGSAGRLKLREMGERAELIFYSRDESGADRWSDYRVAPVSDPAALSTLLGAALGVRGVVAKRRHLYLWRNCRIHLDDVDSLGTFLEFEVLSRGDQEDDRARLSALMASFAIAPGATIPVSYADLLGLD